MNYTHKITVSRGYYENCTSVSEEVSMLVNSETDELAEDFAEALAGIMPSERSDGLLFHHTGTSERITESDDE